MIKLTKGFISREEAIKISKVYVAFADGDFSAFDVIEPLFQKLKRGQYVLTYINGQFIKAKVTSVNHNDFRAIDGPIVRVSNGECSWRVDGSGFAIPI